MTWFTWTPLELVANLFTIICIFLAGRNSIYTWPTGIVGAILYGLMFYNVQLYADTTLQVFFIFTGILGWIGWNSNKVDKPITNVNPKIFGFMLGVAATTTVGYGWLLHSFTDAYAPWIDSAVLTFSVVAQLLLMGRNIETWKVWVIVNTLSVPLFWSRELYMTSVLYGFFWVNAVYSYFHWKKLMEIK